jgi:hypothetical protein
MSDAPAGGEEEISRTFRVGQGVSARLAPEPSRAADAASR